MEGAENAGAAWTLQTAANEEQIKKDQRVVRDYVKNELWEKVVFLWSKKSLDRGGVLHTAYLRSCKRLLSDGKLVSVADEEAETYMNLLWMQMTKDGSYRAWLGQRRSNTYQAMQDKFNSE